MTRVCCAALSVTVPDDDAPELPPAQTPPDSRDFPSLTNVGLSPVLPDPDVHDVHDVNTPARPFPNGRPSRSGGSGSSRLLPPSGTVADPLDVNQSWVQLDRRAGAGTADGSGGLSQKPTAATAAVPSSARPRAVSGEIPGRYDIT